MSKALLRKSLEIVDPSVIKTTGPKNRKKKPNNVFMSESRKSAASLYVKDPEGRKVNLLKADPKLTILEAKKSIKSPQDILKENLKKIQLIRQASSVILDQSVTHKIIERGVTKRPLKPKRKSKKRQKTAFTEDDFVKFEEEFMNE